MPTVKNVGEPCAGEPHARIDGGREEASLSRHPPRETGAPLAYPTTPDPGQFIQLARVVADADDGEHVERAVESAVAAGSRRYRSDRPQETGNGAHPARRASRASELKRSITISPMRFAASSTPIPGSASSCAATFRTSAAPQTRRARRSTRVDLWPDFGRFTHQKLGDAVAIRPRENGSSEDESEERPRRGPRAIRNVAEHNCGKARTSCRWAG
jgi:hypothetical protein